MKFYRILIFNFFLFFTFLFEVEAKIVNKILLDVGGEIITTQDLEQEIRLISYLNKNNLKQVDINNLQQVGIQSLIKSKIKEKEVQKYNYNRFSERDLNSKLESIKSSLNLNDRDFLLFLNEKKISYENLIEKIILELKWNGLIFDIYKNRLVIDREDIVKQIKSYQKKNVHIEYLLSEIVIENNIETINEDIKNMIETINKIGFESAAIKLSISKSRENGGNIGWISEQQMNEQIKNQLLKTKKGSLTKYIITPEGILILKINDIREKKVQTDLEIIKDKIVNEKKNQLLQSFSASHFQKLKNNTLISVKE